MGRGYAPVDPRLGPVAQLPPARRPAVHGRHPASTPPTASATSRRSTRRAYRYVEVYKGANALRFGANSLGGAINFVTPTGRDASLLGASADIGSFGFHRLQSSSRRRQRPVRLLRHRLMAGAGRLPRPQLGQVDARQRQHRLSLSPGRRDAVLLQRQRDHAAHPRQRDQGRGADVVRRRPRPSTSLNDWQRNIDTWRIANKTTIRARARHHRRVRRVLRRPPPDAPDLPVARLPVRGLRRLRPPHRRALHRRIQEPLPRSASTSTTATYDADQYRQHRRAARARCCPARSTTTPRTSPPTSRTPSISCPTVALVAGAQYPARAARADRQVPVPTAINRAAARSASGARRSACCGRSTAPGRCSPISRAAPRCRASARTCFASASAFRHQGCRRPPPMRSARAGGGPTIHLGPRRLPHGHRATSCSACSVAFGNFR